MTVVPAQEALERLREGNRRFVAGRPAGFVATAPRRAALLKGQRPFAAILGCTDSRVPPETIFDQAPGDLFVVRVAGNVAAPTQMASVEFAAERLRARLVVVLGHTDCGAVDATVEHLAGRGARPDYFAPITDRILPAIEPLVAGRAETDPELLQRRAVRANIAASVGRLQEASSVLSRLAAAESLLVVGAEYSLESGIVEFLNVS